MKLELIAGPGALVPRKEFPDTENLVLDLRDKENCMQAVRGMNEVYNLAAMSFVKTSFEQPVLTGEFQYYVPQHCQTQLSSA